MMAGTKYQGHKKTAGLHKNVHAVKIVLTRIMDIKIRGGTIPL